MRVLFVCYTLESSSGSAYKVVNMAGEWERQGHSVWLATMRSTQPISVADAAAGLRERPRTRSLAERVRGEATFRLLFPSALALACARLGIDVVYSRQLPPAPGLRSLVRGRPFVLEINGDVSREMSALQRMSRVRARSLQLRHADGVVFVSRELERACKPEPRRSLVLANPCPPGAPAAGATRPARPTLVMIGYAKHDWSGMDKVVALAEALPDLDFVMIGAELPGPRNLRCHGPLSQAEADRVMSGCTVGIGPLALHRKGMFEASPLKSRNYLALGLPIIQAYEDTDLTEADDCVLQLPNSDDNVQRNLGRIREFAFRAYGDPALSRRALELGRGRLSLEHKERERLAFIASCVRDARQGGG
jgi:hypothetical protein